MNVHNDALQEAIAAAALADTPVESIDAELSGSTDDLNAASEELGAMSRQVETVGELHVSLESFVYGFMDRVPEGEWDARVARQYRAGITQVMAAHGYTVEPDSVSASFESAGVSQTNDENRTESKTKSDGLISRLLEALKAALAGLGRAITSFATRILNNGTVVRKAAKGLRDSLKVLKNDIPSGEFDNKPKWGVYYQTKDGAASSASMVVHEAPLELNTLLGAWDNSFLTQIKLLSHPGHVDSVRHGGGKATVKVTGGVKFEVEFIDEHFKGAGNNLAKATIKVVTAEQPTGKIPYLSKDEIYKVADAMDSAADAMKVMSEQGKPIEEAIKKLMGELKTRTGQAKADAKGSDTSAAQAVSGAEQVRLVRQMISRYPLAMQVLIPQVAKVCLNAWRHSMASISKAHAEGKK